MPPIFVLETMADQITYIDRESGKKITEQVPGGGFLRFLYHNPFGKIALWTAFKRKFVSGFMGWLMNTRFSHRSIANFLRKYNMHLGEYIVPVEGFKTFNDFFYRKIQDGARPIGEGLVSPADGKTVAFATVEANTKFFVKGWEFTVSDFLQDATLAKKFEGGAMVIVRLAPVDYHRFHFPAAGKASPATLVDGAYYSVSPIALKNSLEIFCQNKREYMVLDSPDFGDILICDVGATMVGTIIQTYQGNAQVAKGDEKGYFAFGGSTVVLLFEPGKVQLDQDLLENSANGIEMQVKMGTTIGQAVQ